MSSNREKLRAIELEITRRNVRMLSLDKDIQRVREERWRVQQETKAAQKALDERKERDARCDDVAPMACELLSEERRTLAEMVARTQCRRINSESQLKELLFRSDELQLEQAQAEKHLRRAVKTSGELHRAVRQAESTHERMRRENRELIQNITASELRNQKLANKTGIVLEETRQCLNQTKRSRAQCLAITTAEDEIARQLTEVQHVNSQLIDWIHARRFQQRVGCSGTSSAKATMTVEEPLNEASSETTVPDQTTSLMANFGEALGRLMHTLELRP